MGKGIRGGVMISDTGKDGTKKQKERKQWHH